MDGANIIFFCLLYVLIGIVFLCFLLKKSRRFCPAYKGFMFGMFFYYIIIPIIVLLNIEELNSIELAKGKYCTYSVQRFIIDGDFWKFLYAIVIIVIGLIFFYLFYNASKKMKVREYDAKRTIKFVSFFAAVTFFVGAISLVIVFLSFGGIESALSYAEYLRSFDSDASELVGQNTIFMILARLITVTPFLLVYMIQNSFVKKRFYKAALLISFVLAILYFLFNAGKAPLIAFIICFSYVIIRKKVKKPWMFIIIICIIALPMLDFLDSLFYYFNSKEFTIKEINYLKYILQFTTPYKNTLAMTDIVSEYGLRYCLDFVTAFLDFIPGLHFQASYVNTSEFIVGVNWTELGGIPNDFITFGYIEFSFIGVIILSSILGFFLQIIDKKLSNFNDDNAKHLFSAALSIYIFLSIPSFDIISMLKGGWILNVILIIILFSSRKE